jgi:L-alanine-DL-glutamate epimerase-like enolase superfamily enzyme
MRLASVEVIPCALPFREPYVTARGRLERREMVLLRVRDEEGLVGLGEAVPLSLRGGEGLKRVVEELELLDRLDEVEERELEGPLLRSAPARCAALTALFDLRERRAAAAGKPADAPEPVPCNATLIAGRPAAVAEEAIRWQEDGFRTFKLKLGVGDDLAQVTAVREALGPAAQIRIDVNAAWDVATARRVLPQLEPLGIQLAEQPVASIEEAATLSRQISIPLSADESVESAEDAARAVALGAFQLTGVKLSKVGGPPAAIEVAERLPAYLSSALDGPVGIAAAARVAAGLGDGPWPASGERAHGLATQRLFAETIASVECELRDGMLHPPPGPGLGVEIDEGALNAHRL